MFKAVLSSYKDDYIYKQFKLSNPDASFPENIQDALSSIEKSELETICNNLRAKVEKKWQSIEHTFLWKLLMTAQEIIIENPNVDILYSPKHGYYYSSVRWHNGYYESTSDAPITSASDMLKYIEIIWVWNDYQQYNLNYYVPDIREILEDLQNSLPAGVWAKESTRRNKALAPFYEMVTTYYNATYVGESEKR